MQTRAAVLNHLAGGGRIALDLAAPEIVLQLISEGWAEVGEEWGQRVCRRSPLVGRVVHLDPAAPAALEVEQNIGEIARVSYHARSGGQAVVRWAGGHVTRRPLGELRLQGDQPCQQAQESSPSYHDSAPGHTVASAGSSAGG